MEIRSVSETNNMNVIYMYMTQNNTHMHNSK